MVRASCVPTRFIEMAELTRREIADCRAMLISWQGMREPTTRVHPKRKQGRTSERRGGGAFSLVRNVTRYITPTLGSRRWWHLESALVYAEARDLPLKSLAGDSELDGRTTGA